MFANVPLPDFPKYKKYRVVALGVVFGVLLLGLGFLLRPYSDSVFIISVFGAGGVLILSVAMVIVHIVNDRMDTENLPGFAHAVIDSYLVAGHLVQRRDYDALQKVRDCLLEEQAESLKVQDEQSARIKELEKALATRLLVDDFVAVLGERANSNDILATYVQFFKAAHKNRQRLHPELHAAIMRYSQRSAASRTNEVVGYIVVNAEEFTYLDKTAIATALGLNVSQNAWLDDTPVEAVADSDVESELEELFDDTRLKELLAKHGNPSLAMHTVVPEPQQRVVTPESRNVIPIPALTNGDAQPQKSQGGAAQPQRPFGSGEEKDMGKKGIHEAPDVPGLTQPSKPNAGDTHPIKVNTEEKKKMSNGGKFRRRAGFALRQLTRFAFLVPIIFLGYLIIDDLNRSGNSVAVWVVFATVVVSLLATFWYLNPDRHEGGPGCGTRFVQGITIVLLIAVGVFALYRNGAVELPSEAEAQISAVENSFSTIVAGLTPEGEVTVPPVVNTPTLIPISTDTPVPTLTSTPLPTATLTSAPTSTALPTDSVGDDLCELVPSACEPGS